MRFDACRCLFKVYGQFGLRLGALCVAGFCASYGLRQVEVYGVSALRALLNARGTQCLQGQYIYLVWPMANWGGFHVWSGGVFSVAFRIKLFLKS